MVWLAIDSSGKSGSVALEKDGELLFQSYFNIEITHSETLMPQVDAGLKLCGLQPGDIGGLVTTSGPGSFTGLRIGLATAKGIAYAHKIPLLTYTSLQLVAANCYGSNLPILVCLDAKMKEIYAALFRDLSELLPPMVIKPELLARQIDQPILLLGNATERVLPLLQEKGLDCQTALWQQNLPMAAGLLALRRYLPQPETYDFDALAKLEPNYLREATAQVKRSSK